MAPRTRNANRHEPNVENVIHTQSRWVLKGQICNLLTLTDVVPHQTAASNGMGNNNNNNNKNGENILEVWWEMWIIESNHSHTTYPISRSPFEWKWNYLYKPTITPPFLFFFYGIFRLWRKREVLILSSAAQIEAVRRGRRGYTYICQWGQITPHYGPRNHAIMHTAVAHD